MDRSYNDQDRPAGQTQGREAEPGEDEIIEFRSEMSLAMAERIDFYEDDRFEDEGIEEI